MARSGMHMVLGYCSLPHSHARARARARENKRIQNPAPNSAPRENHTSPKHDSIIATRKEADTGCKECNARRLWIDDGPRILRRCVVRCTYAALYAHQAKAEAGDTISGGMKERVVHVDLRVWG